MSDQKTDPSERFRGFEAIPIRIVVRVGETLCRLGELDRLEPGTTVRLDHEVGEPFELMSGGVVLGFVEPVADKEGVALKLTSVPESDDGAGN